MRSFRCGVQLTHWRAGTVNSYFTFLRRGSDNQAPLTEGRQDRDKKGSPRAADLTAWTRSRSMRILKT